MRRSILSTAAALAASLLIAGVAYAQPRIQQAPPSQQPSQPQQPQGQSGGGDTLPGANADVTSQVLKAAGYQNVEIVTVESNRHVKAQIHGQNLIFIHQQCQGNTCKSGTFFAQYGPQQGIDQNWVNAWNVEKRFAKLSIQKNGNLTFEYDVHFYSDGVSATNFRDSAVLFGHLLKALLEFKPS